MSATMTVVSVKTIPSDGRIRERLAATVDVRGKRGTLTLWSDNSVTSDPAWLIDRIGGSRSDAKLAARKAIQAANSDR